MYDTTTLELSMVLLLKSKTLTVDRIEFTSYGSDRRANVRIHVEDDTAVFWAVPKGDEDVQVSLRLVNDRKPKHLPRTRLTRTVSPEEVPQTVTNLVQKVLSLRTSEDTVSK